MGNRKDKTKAKLCLIPVIKESFKRIGIEIVGSLPRAFRRGNKYLFTVMDYASRYPETVPLHNIEVSTVANALVNIIMGKFFSTEIVPHVDLSFASRLIQRLCQDCVVKHLTPFHLERNGLIEILNGTSTKMIKAYVAETPNDWVKKLQYLLNAYRDIPQETLGFSPFELPFGRSSWSTQSFMSKLGIGNRK